MIPLLNLLFFLVCLHNLIRYEYFPLMFKEIIKKHILNISIPVVRIRNKNALLLFYNDTAQEML
jgi:hypothetical protein